MVDKDGVSKSGKRVLGNGCRQHSARAYCNTHPRGQRAGLVRGTCREVADRRKYANQRVADASDLEHAVITGVDESGGPRLVSAGRDTITCVGKRHPRVGWRAARHIANAVDKILVTRAAPGAEVIFRIDRTTDR